MSYEKKWLLQWLLKHGLEATIKDPGRNPCSFYAARVKVWWMDGVFFFLSSHYDSGFTIVGIYINIRIPMNGFHDYIPIYDPIWVVYYNIM